MVAVVLPEAIRALFPFKPHTFTLSDGKRMHYIDEGPQDGDVLVFVHGYPMWSFVYRALIVYYAALGYRCIAMDHIGFGLSDKPIQRHYHTPAQHIENLTSLLESLALTRMTLIMEDWGGPLGLAYAIHAPETIRRLVIMNAWGFQDSYENRLHPMIRLVTKPGIGELLFGVFNLVFSLGVQRWTARQLSPAVMAAYRAPFRETRHRAALVQFPRMINVNAEHPSAPTMRAIESGLASLGDIPSLIIWGEEDPLFPPDVARHWKTLLPRAHGPCFIPGASHFPVEDDPESVTRCLDEFLEWTRTRD